MLGGVAQKIFKQPVTCREHRCSATGGNFCEFEAVIESDNDTA
jgi:predicted hydrocarbon binding protein